jgi:hypothetical protein
VIYADLLKRIQINNACRKRKYY